jgi:acetate kinase
MARVILVLNAGSSSLKFTAFREAADGLEVAFRGQVSGIGAHPRFEARSAAGLSLAERSWAEGECPTHQELMRFMIDWIEERMAGHAVVAAGHRVVHGGDRFGAPTVVDEAALAELERLVPLAPLHQPHSLAPIRALAQIHPGLPQVACFDTAFHRGQDEVVRRFALPRALHEAGVKRYGFHGLSYEFVARALEALDPGLARGRVVVAHLGSGASMCAINEGASVESSMGFTALDGLMMGTRCGTLDAGVVLHLIREGMSPAEVEAMLYKRSGLLGVSGISPDMRDLLEAVRAGNPDPRAAEAVALFVHRVSRELGALAATLGGLDGLVFTAGIGERSAEIRARVAERARWLGVRVDLAANEAAGSGARRISPPGAPVTVWVIPTDEELMIGLHTRAALARCPASGLDPAPPALAPRKEPVHA